MQRELENAPRSFSSSALAKFPYEKKIERKFILGKNHHHTIYTGGHHRESTVTDKGLFR
jgi:hypothetical protein